VKWNKGAYNNNANKINENIRRGQENKLIETYKIYKNTREIDIFKTGENNITYYHVFLYSGSVFFVFVVIEEDNSLECNKVVLLK